MYLLRKAGLIFLVLVFAMSLIWAGSVRSGALAAPLMSETAQALPFYQGWTNTALLNSADNWNNVPGIVGYATGLTTGVGGVNPSTITDPVPVGTGYSVAANYIAPELEPNNYGVAEFELPNPTIALRGSVLTQVPHIIINVNTTGVTGVEVTYKARDIDGSASNATEQVALQYRVGNAGSFINVPDGYIADATTGPYQSTLVTTRTATLPADADNQPLVQVRIITTDANLTDEWFGIDDIAIADDLPPLVNTVSPADSQAAVAVNADINVTFSETVNLTGTWYTLKCNDLDVPAAVTGSGASYTINPDADFALGAACVLTVIKDQVVDTAASPQTMPENFTSRFTVAGCGAPGAGFTPIGTIQGSGTASPVEDTTVTTEGIVTSVPAGINGFFIQSQTADADEATSEGLFVDGIATGMAVGDRVRVTGIVQEFRAVAPGQMAEMTRLTAVTAREECEAGVALPAVTQLDLSTPVANATFLERYEGMRVGLLGNLTVQGTDYLGSFGQLLLGGGGRIYHLNNATGGAASDYLRMVVLDDNAHVVPPSPNPYYPVDGSLRAGDQVTGVEGILDQGWIDGLTAGTGFPLLYYRLQPTSSPVFTKTILNPRPVSAPAVAGTIKAASFDVNKFFITLNAGGANNATELTQQRNKLVRAIAGLNADVVGLTSIEASDAANAVNDLVNALNAYVGPGTYAFVADPAGTGTDVMQSALIYKPAVLNLSGAASSLVDAAFERYPISQTFEVKSNSEKFTVVVSHFTERDNCPLSGDVDTGMGCWNLKRTQQATALLPFIASLTAVDPDVVVVGNLNAYPAETPVTTLVSGGLTNQALNIAAADRYSYVRDGMAGYLDYALTTVSVGRQMGGTAFWHINADEPAFIDYNTESKPAGYYTLNAFRSSNHDPLMVGLNIIKNNVPELDHPIGEQPATEDQLFTFTVPVDTFSEPDAGDSIVAYTAAQQDGNPLPAWLTFNPVTRQFSGTPLNEDVGTVAVQVRAYDTSNEYGSANFNIVVANVNDAPTVDAGIADKAVLVTLPFTFQINADAFKDVDAGDSLSYSAALAGGGSLPTWLVFDPGTKTFSGTAPASSFSVTVRVTATDLSAESVYDDFILTVRANAVPTVVNQIPNQTATEDVDFLFQFAENTFSDADPEDQLSYAATLADGSALPAWLKFEETNPRTFSGKPLNENVGTITVKVTATDLVGASVSDEFTITVGNSNDAPTLANPIADQKAYTSRAFTFQFASNVFEDVDVGDSLTFTATLADGSPLPAWLKFEETTPRTFSGTPALADLGIISIKVTASDGEASVSDTFDLAVETLIFLPIISR